MRLLGVQEHKYLFAFVGAGIAIVLIVIGVAGSLLNAIDQQLRNDTEQQIQVITEQASENVGDRIELTENIIKSFTVHTADTERIRQSMHELKSSCGFAEVAFIDIEGNCYCSGEGSFSSADVSLSPIARTAGEVIYRTPHVGSQGEFLFQAEKPLVLDGEEIGTLYINIPLAMVIDEENFSVYNNQGHLLLFDRSSGLVLVSSQEQMQELEQGKERGEEQEQAQEKEHSLPFEGDSLYDFLSEMKLENSVLEKDASEQRSALNYLEDAIKADESELVVASVGGEEWYVCVVPLAIDDLYTCSIIPEKSARSEITSIDTTFIVIFGIILFSLLAVLAMFSFLYRKRMGEKGLEMKTHLYGALSDSLDMAVNMYSPDDGVVTPIVAKSREIIGYSMAEIMGNSHVADRISLSAPGREIFDRLRSGEIASLERGEFSFKNRQTAALRWVTYSVNPFYYENKRQLLVVFQDSTNAKNLQLSMKDAMVAAETANHAKSDFLSRMSHEIRTPMNAIIGMTQIAEKHLDDPEKISASLGKINLASDHLLSLINDVLDISKIESGKMMLINEPFNLDKLIESVNLVITAQAEQRNQEFIITRKNIIEQIFVGDRMRLQQVLINLLTNSVKYTPHQGKISLHVSQKRSPVANYIETTFVVSDNGIGMSESYLKHLFEPFSMEERSRSQGTGLGMSIVKNILTMMNGDIHAESVLDKGTTFTVVINLECASPENTDKLEGFRDAGGQRIDAGSYGLAAEQGITSAGLSTGSHTDSAQPEAVKINSSADEKEGNASENAHALSGKATSHAHSKHPASSDDAFYLEESPENESKKNIDLSGVHVLLAEDNDLNAEIACELLEDAGLVVDWAKDGEAACLMFEQSEPGFFDLVLMDIQMPKLTGYEATARIRATAREDAQNIPIIAMSANAFTEDIQASLRSGMNDHLSKPIDIKLVLNSIARQISQRIK